MGSALQPFDLLVGLLMAMEMCPFLCLEVRICFWSTGHVQVGADRPEAWSWCQWRSGGLSLPMLTQVTLGECIKDFFFLFNSRADEV